MRKSYHRNRNFLLFVLLTIVDGVLSIYEIRKGKRTLTSVLSLIEGEEEKIWDLLGLFGRAKANTPHSNLLTIRIGIW